MLNHNDNLKTTISELESTIERYKNKIKELDQTVTDLNNVIINLQLENEGLKRQVEFLKNLCDDSRLLYIQNSSLKEQELEKCQKELYELRKHLNIQQFYEDNISHDFLEGMEN